jgi:hypothetical protein
VSKVIFFEDGAGGLLSLAPSFADRDRRSILVAEAVLEDRLIPAVKDNDGNEIAPERVETFVAVPERRRLETDDELVARVAASALPAGAAFAVFPAGTAPSDPAVIARFPNAAAQIAARLLADKLADVEARAESLRQAVAGTASATKMAAYREKYAVAQRALAGEADARDALAGEAAERGETPLQLAALVKTLAEAWTAAGLAIDTAYQGHKRRLLALAAGGDAAGVASYNTSAGWPALPQR